VTRVQRLVIGCGGIVALVCGGLGWWFHHWLEEGLVARTPVLVEDSPYGNELRALPRYGDTPSEREARPYMGPGWYSRRSANGRFVAATESWGDALSNSTLGLVLDRPYIHTVGVWDEDSGRFKRVVSVMEADPGSGIAHRYAWSKDSKALLLYGGGGLSDNYRKRLILCVIYLPESDELYRLAKCPRE
jgi:hypothetical protein